MRWLPCQLRSCQGQYLVWPSRDFLPRQLRRQVAIVCTSNTQQYCNQPSMNRNNRCWSAVETTVTTTRLDQHSRQDKKAFHFNHEALDIKYRTINNNYNSFHLIVVIIATSLSLHATISLQKQYLRARTIINNVFIYGKTYQDKTIWLDGAGRGGQDVTDG